MKFGAETESAPETAGGWPDDGREHAPARWERKGGDVAWSRVIVALILAGVLAYLMLSPGGIRARLSGVDSGLRNAVADITQNRAMEDASTMFNKWYKQQGRYPNETQSQLDQDPNAKWGPGMDVQWCSPRAVVLTSLTVSGTISRLLLDGKSKGDVSGSVGCPADLDNPAPWSG